MFSFIADLVVTCYSKFFLILIRNNLELYSTNKLSMNGYDFAAPDTKNHENTTL